MAGGNYRSGEGGVMSKLETLKAKIRALQEKTIANGCTEYEAMAASQKAAKLMSEYRISDASLHISEKATRSNNSGNSSLGMLWSTIAWCTNTKCIIIDQGNSRLVNFIGNDPGPEIAIYLRDICERAINSALKAFKEGHFYKSRRKAATKRAATQDFIDGMVFRLCVCLKELFENQHSETACASAEQALQENYHGNFPVKQTKRKEKYRHAGNSGWLAGGRVQLKHGVNEGETAPALGNLR